VQRARSGEEKRRGEKEKGSDRVGISGSANLSTVRRDGKGGEGGENEEGLKNCRRWRLSRDKRWRYCSEIAIVLISSIL